MDDINIGRFKNILKVVAITNLMVSGVITHEDALKSSAYRHFLKEELQLNAEEVKVKIKRKDDKK